MQRRRYEEIMYESLRDPQVAAEYLNAALESNSPEDFLLALRHVSNAQGMTDTARKADLTREALYRMTGEDGNPRYTSLRSLLDALGLELQIGIKAEKGC